MAVRNFQCRYKIYTKKEIDKIIDDLDIDLTDYYTKSEIDTKLADKQNVLTAGTNISISEQNVISATGGTEYTAGNNIQISEQNVISATDTVYTAGTNVSISEQNVISAVGSDWELRTPDNDWSDLFEIVETNKVKAKKTIMIACISDNLCLSGIIVPSSNAYSTINLASGIYLQETNHYSPLTIGRVLTIGSTNISSNSTTIPVSYRQVSFELDTNNAIKLTLSTTSAGMSN